MSSLLRDYAGQVKLIYIDPPFATGDDFSVDIRVGDADVVKEPSILEEHAYRDTWGSGYDSYLSMMYERLILMHELLADDGSIYVHCDWRVNSYLRLMLDEGSVPTTSRTKSCGGIGSGARARSTSSEITMFCSSTRRVRATPSTSCAYHYQQARSNDSVGNAKSLQTKTERGRLWARRNNQKRLCPVSGTTTRFRLIQPSGLTTPLRSRKPS